MSHMGEMISWLKSRAITIALVLVAAVFVVIAVLCFWLKIRGFKMSNLTGLLEIANAKNEISHLEVRRGALAAKGDVKKDQIRQVELELRDEERKLEKARMEIKGLSNEEVAARLTKLGY